MDSTIPTMVSELASLGSTLSSMPSVLMVGLDSVGKSTIINKLQGKAVSDAFLIGLSAYSVHYKDFQFTLWDISGQMKKLKMFLSLCFKNTKAIILVVDSSDRERVDEAAAELTVSCLQDQLKEIALLVFANKQDLPNIMPVSELIDKLKLNQLENHRWHIQPISAIQEAGLNEGMDWLYNEVTK